MGLINRLRVSARWLLALALAAVFFTSPSVYAASTPDIGASAQGLEISPTIIELNAEKNNTYTLKLSVTNVTARDLVVTGRVDDFTVKDETGTPKILNDLQEAAESPTVSFKSWTKPLGDLSLAAHATDTISVPVSVPANAEAGGHYGVIRFTGHLPSLTTQNIGLTASVGSLVLVRVAGNISERLSVASFSVTKGGHNVGIVQNGPLNIVTRFENIGNVHVQPNGLITVKNIFGQTTATLPLTNQPGNVLPDSIRRFSQTLNKKWLFGRYTLSMNATYGTTGKTISASTSFWAIPIELILIILLVLALLILALTKGLKRYNQMILGRAGSAPVKRSSAKKSKSAKKKK